MIIYGIISTTNTNDDIVNLVIKNSSGVMYNIKTTRDVSQKLKLNHVYEFTVKVEEGQRTRYILDKVNDVSSFNDEKRYS